MATALSALSEKKVVEGLAAKLEAKSARVGVIGMGFVLLPLALSFAHTGFATTAWTLRWSMN